MISSEKKIALPDATVLLYHAVFSKLIKSLHAYLICPGVKNHKHALHHHNRPINDDTKIDCAQ